MTDDTMMSLLREYGRGGVPIDREYRVVMKPGAVIVSRFSTREAAERYAAELNRRLEGNYCTVRP